MNMLFVVKTVVHKTFNGLFVSATSKMQMSILLTLLAVGIVLLLAGFTFGILTDLSGGFALFFWSSFGFSSKSSNFPGRDYGALHRHHPHSYISSRLGAGCLKESNEQGEYCHNSDGAARSDRYFDTSVSIRHKQRFPSSSDVKREAVAAMNMALDLQNRGRVEKAMKVFQHALALDPSHADILTAFGEFLEWHIKDVVSADHMYQVALENSPEHNRALINRNRTAPLVEQIDHIQFDRVDKKRDLLFKIPNSHPGLRRAKKEAYFAHIYHTNAIEGNTLSLAQTRSIVETRLAIGGKSLREQNEVLGLDAALSYINSTLVGKVGRLTLQDILDIHTRVLGFVDPTEAGHFRHNQVYVGDFTPPPAGELPDEMDGLVEWLNSPTSLALHPVEFAALAHYRLVTIHPFYDGNGRTSRLLMNLILMQAGFPPVSIEVSDRLAYYETLQQGNDGDIRPFIRFIAKCAERTLDEYLSVTMDDVDSSHVINTGNLQKTRHPPRGRVIVLGDGEEDDEDEFSGSHDRYDNIRENTDRTRSSINENDKYFQGGDRKTDAKFQDRVEKSEELHIQSCDDENICENVIYAENSDARHKLDKEKDKWS